MKKNYINSEKPKIFFISYRFSLKKLTGDQVVLINRIKILSSKNYSLTIIVPAKKSEKKQVKKYFESIVPGIKIFTFESASFIEKAFNILRSFFFNKSIQEQLFKNKKASKLINQVLHNEDNYKIVLITIRSVCLLDENNIKNDLITIEMIDSLSENIKSFKDRVNLIKKLIYEREIQLLKVFEKKIIKKFSSTIFVSAKDSESFATNKKVFIINQGIDLNLFRKIKCKKVKNSILFSGNLNYLPNIEAINWFYINVFPILKAQSRNYCFYILGRGWSQKLNPLKKEKNIKIIGPVDSLAKEIPKYFVSIAPMISGSGVQNKILEALATGLPVIATKIGNDGINLKNYKNGIICDDPREFAKSINLLFKNQEIYEKISNEGYSFINNEFSFQALSNKIEKAYNLKTKSP